MLQLPQQGVFCLGKVARVEDGYKGRGDEWIGVQDVKFTNNKKF